MKANSIFFIPLGVPSRIRTHDIQFKEITNPPLQGNVPCDSTKKLPRFTKKIKYKSALAIIPKKFICVGVTDLSFS